MRIGIDLGGTKIEAIALDADGRELLRRRVATPVGNYEGTLDAVARLVLDADHEIGKRGTVGIGTPGAISAATGRLKNSNSVCLIGQPIREDLERRLGIQELLDPSRLEGQDLGSHERGRPGVLGPEQLDLLARLDEHAPPRVLERHRTRLGDLLHEAPEASRPVLALGERRVELEQRALEEIGRAHV